MGLNFFHLQFVHFSFVQGNQLLQFQHMIKGL